MEGGNGIRGNHALEHLDGVVLNHPDMIETLVMDTLQ